jgi:hypothetical protein
VLVDFAGGVDLIPVTLWDISKLSIPEIAQKINDRVNTAK